MKHRTSFSSSACSRARSSSRPTPNSDAEDPRYGAVAGARADQQNVTLDGIDVNDPQNQTAFTSAVRITQEALQEFRVSTSNYNADSGRSSGAQVSLVTKSGTNQYNGSGYWTLRRTQTSSNEYFLKLAQLLGGKENQAPKLDKDIYGGAFSGPVQRNRLFFFGNIERLQEQSESPVVRGVPSNSFRDGVLMYQCASAAVCPGGSVRGLSNTHTVPSGWYGMTPADIAAIDPLRIGPSLAAARYFSQYPSPNEPGQRPNNIDSFRFASPIENQFYTFLTRVDYNLSSTGDHKLFGRFGKQDDTINEAAQFPGQPARRQALRANFGLALGYDTVLTSHLTNSFRYGMTRIDESNEGRTDANYVTFRFIDPFDALGSTFTDSRQPNTHNFVDDVNWFKGTHGFKAGTNIRYSRVPKERFQSSYLNATGQSLMGGRRRPAQHAGQRVLHGGPLFRASGSGERGPGRLRGRLAQHHWRAVAVDPARQLRSRRHAAGAGNSGRSHGRLGRVRGLPAG